MSDACRCNEGLAANEVVDCSLAHAFGGMGNCANRDAGTLSKVLQRSQRTPHIRSLVAVDFETHVRSNWIERDQRNIAPFTSYFFKRLQILAKHKILILAAAPYPSQHAHATDISTCCCQTRFEHISHRIF